MDGFTLVIGDRNLSSWSLRPWLLLRQLGVAFETVAVRLDRPETRAEILLHSPSGRVPLLRHGGLAIWDSLAIVEYLGELFATGVWPAERAQRAVARACAAEMHAGFQALRQELPMDFARRRPGHRWSAAAAADIARIVEIWEAARTAADDAGPFLFGRFGAVDAMFAPVVSRFVTYDVPLAGAALAYRDAVWALPAMADWHAAAAAEIAAG